MSKTLSLISDGEYIQVRFDWNKDMLRYVKNYPGRRWHKEEKYWSVPKDGLEYLQAAKDELGYKIICSTNLLNSPEDTIPSEINTQLYLYQQIGVSKILNSDAMLLNFETGLGKTPVTIEAMRLDSGPIKALIVCPAIMLETWVRELYLWWPEDTPYTIRFKGEGDVQRFNEMGKAILLSSYGMVSKLVSYIGDSSLSHIVLDESHYIKNSKTKRTKALVDIRNLHPEAKRILLTATPAANQPKDFWSQLDFLRPGYYGSFWTFAEHYCRLVTNEFGTKVEGINDENIEQFKQRFAQIGYRVTKIDAAEYLPTLMTSQTRIELTPSEQKQLRERAALAMSDDAEAAIASVAFNVATAKVRATVERVMAAIDSGEEKVAVLPYYKATGRQITESLKLNLPKGYSLTYVDGDISPDKRDQQIQYAIAEPKSVLVATMRSVGIGIDLTAFPKAIFSELDYSPEKMIQALGRFSRLSGKVPSSVEFLILSGTIDEIIMSRLDEKINDINSMVRAGLSEQKLSEALGAQQESDDDFSQRLSVFVENDTTDIFSIDSGFELD